MSQPLNNNETVKVVHINKRGKNENDGNNDDDDDDDDDDYDYEKHLIVVKFHQFSKVKCQRLTEKYSPVFGCGGVRWKFMLKFSKNDAQWVGCCYSPQRYLVGMYLYLDEASWLLDEEYSVKYTASIPKLGITNTTREHTFCLGKNTNRGWNEYTTMKQVLDRGLDDDILSIHIKFDQLEHICKRWTSSLSFNKERLKMLRTEAHTDITFVVGSSDQQQRIKANTRQLLLGAPAM
eukprot:CAMPEP_0198133066 /NCGR_PEP_ID=MMETSP1442-20131203/59374_1 /TAXON_ID= /ORGANISM="Craspedostauros australis, Strain CCMP3328" /LENGTH=234 /DNA_ID=CAMNT_0043794171 /DNA_START=803 /DNA_END=1504 /DNA_ORIENTATION=-